MSYKKFIILFLFLGLAIPVFSFADDLGTQCAQLSETSGGCPSLSSADCKALLQKCSDYYDQQATQIASDITKTSKQKNTLANQISSLKSKINGLEAQISQGTIKVKGLNYQITDTQSSIDKTSTEISTSQEQIVNILRAIHEQDKKPSVEILLEGSLSDFFSNVAYLENLNSSISTLLENTKDLQTYLQGQKQKMDTEVNQLQQTLALQASQKQENEANKKTQEQYLKLTESQYQQQLQDKKDVEAKAAKIKSMLFQMAGVTNAPTFGQALDVAKTVASMVGIRPAFLLAEISQESAIGKNVGQCYLTNQSTGDGIKISTGAAIIRVMKPNRDVAPFLSITAAAGRDPAKTPVSCWIRAYVGGQPTGWGGAMGPAQFIPSTWALFADRLKSLLGQTADPWATKDSFTAAGLYLADLGATAQTSAAESKAASRYYGGSSAYARSVLAKEACIQSFIDNSTMSTACQNLIF